MSPAARTAAIVGAPVVIAYLNSLSGSFQFDDFNVIVHNPAAHSFAAWWDDVGQGIRPLLKLTYAINWTIGADALGFHVVNVAVHLANTFLVFVLVRLVIPAYGEPVARHAPAVAIIAALLFGLHPAQTEAVSYVSGRSGSLMATFYLGATAAYVAGALHERRLLIYGLSPLLFCLALATKETAISLPLVLLLWEASRVDRHDWRQATRRLAVHAIALLGAAAAFAGHPVYAHRVIPDLSPQAVYQSLLTQVDAVTYLVTRLVAVHPLNIDPDVRVANYWSWSLALKAVFLLGLIAFGAWALRRRPWCGFGVLWFFVALLPTNSLLPRLDLANDRQLYLASVGVFMAFGAEIELLRGRINWARTWVRPSLAGLLLVFAGLTSLRNLDYATETRLWEQTAQVSPRKPRVFNNLGFAYGAAGCLEQAEAAYREALRLNPDYAVARDNLASLLYRSKSQTVVRC
jgi:hypothetical protein